jgi:hypothetical protein
MEVLREFLNDLKRHGYAQGNFLGMLHVLIGRQIRTGDGRIITRGLTWRALAELLKKVRWPREAVGELGLDPSLLAPRNRQRFWYQAIAQAQVGSQPAAEAGDRFAEVLRSAGYLVSAGPAIKP